MTRRGWWVRGVVLSSALLLAPVGAWADKLTNLEQAFETQQRSLQQLQQEMHWLRANYLLTDVRPGRNTIGVSNSTHGELVHEGIAELQIQF